MSKQTMVTTKSNIRIVFLGTPEIAADTLGALIDAGYKPNAVITRPDRPKGRSSQPQPSAVKRVALANGIEVLQPDTRQELHQALQNLKPNLIVLVAFGMILSQADLDIPNLGVINIHYSLLPQYRGAAPYVESILNGDAETGVSIVLTTLKLDEGDLIAQRKIGLTGNETQAGLLSQLNKVGADLLVQVLPDWISGKIKPRRQIGKPSYTGLIKKEAGAILWNEPAELIERKIRAYNPWPCTFTHLNERSVKIEKGIVTDKILDPGVVHITGKRLLIGTGTHALEILTLKPEGKHSMSAADYLNGLKSITTK